MKKTKKLVDTQKLEDLGNEPAGGKLELKAAIR